MSDTKISVKSIGQKILKSKLLFWICVLFAPYIAIVLDLMYKHLRKKRAIECVVVVYCVLMSTVMFNTFKANLFGNNKSTIQSPPVISNTPVIDTSIATPDIAEEETNVGEPEDTRQADFDSLVKNDGVILYAEHNFPDNLLSDKHLLKITVTDVVCDERNIIEYLLGKTDQLYKMDSINFDSVFERHDVLGELTGIRAADYYKTYCKIIMKVERIWTYDYDDTLLLDRNLFSAKCYSDILGEYTGTIFDSGLFLVDDYESESNKLLFHRNSELLFDEGTNAHTVEVVVVLHYNEYDEAYDNYNVMFNDITVINGEFNIRKLIQK